MKNIIALTILSLLISCTTKNENVKTKVDFDSQGHRGCRGLLPENTIPAFLKAIDLNMKTLELDCVISADDQVVVSHEAFFNHSISTGPNGEVITEENEKEHNLYQLTYEEIKSYDVGLKFHARFPDQKKIESYKPLLKDVVLSSDEHAEEIKKPLPYYNIEIKRAPEYDGLFNPPVRKFVKLVMEQIAQLGIANRTTVQSFDLETLRIVKEISPNQTTALLIENMNSIDSNLEALGYTPEIYSCYFKLLNKEKVNHLKDLGIKVIPWTVNEEKDLFETIEMGVDGIITDYPDRLNKVRAKLES